MENNKKVILHIIADSVHFDILSNRFDQMTGYKNIYLFNAFGKISHIQNIKNISKVVIAQNEEEWGKIVGNSNIDIIYFHGLWLESTKAIRYIHEHAIVVWWCFGMEIYETGLGIAPILPIKLYKPKTLHLCLKRTLSHYRSISRLLVYFFPSIFNFLKWIQSPKRVKEIYKMLERVNYLFTPLNIEYEEVTHKCKRINAKPFRLVFYSKDQKPSPNYHLTSSALLIDHSAHITNNHLDIFHALRRFNLNSRTLIIPISYGDSYLQKEIKKLSNFNNSKTKFIEGSLPLKDYRNIIGTCSHAFFGGMRQTALGNISYLIRTGVKIFFFKDSILYKHYKKMGFYVYSIESLNEKELITPLSKDEALHNYNLYFKDYGISHETYEQQFDKLLLDKKNE